jgi:hypothetical protein
VLALFEREQQLLLGMSREKVTRLTSYVGYFLDIGDIAHPDLIWSVRFELLD